MNRIIKRDIEGISTDKLMNICEQLSGDWFVYNEEMKVVPHMHMVVMPATYPLPRSPYLFPHVDPPL
jgi:hypothetical protein